MKFIFPAPFPRLKLHTSIGRRVSKWDAAFNILDEIGSLKLHHVSYKNKVHREVA